MNGKRARTTLAYFAALSLGVTIAPTFAEGAASLPYSEGFESGLDGWTSNTTSGVASWRVADRPEGISIANDIYPVAVSISDQGIFLSAAGGTHVAWFGEESTGSYIGSDHPVETTKNGGTSKTSQAGTLTSPSISLIGVSKATLEFDSWWELEGLVGLSYDMMRVYISTNDGASYSLLGSLNPTFNTTAPSVSGYTSAGPSTPPAWRHYVFDLSAYAGNDVLLRFSFDTVDTAFNGFRGWTIDNVSVTGASSLPGPTVSSVTPNIGIANDHLIIQGSNFLQGARVYVGATLVSTTNTMQFGSNYLFIKAPAVVAGTYNVRVVNPDTQENTLSNGFTYSTSTSPAASGISPNWDTIGTSSSHTISGANFVSGATVTVGGLPATNVSFVSSSQLTATFPALNAGYHNVVVTNPNGQRGTKYGGFSIVDSSTLSLTAPNGGETWNTGSAHNITWTTSGANQVDLALYKGGVWVADIASSVTASDGSYSWTPPGSLADGSDYTVRVRVSDGITFDTSDASFTLGSSSPTTTALSSTANPSIYGQEITLTATVSPSSATGTVQFSIDGVAYGSPVSLSGGVATLTVSTLGVGTHSIFAVYSGGGSMTGSSDTLSQVVSQSSSVTTLDSSPNPSVYGQMITFHATVTLPSELIATGQAAFYMDSILIGTATLDGSGVATLQVIGMPVGSKSMTAIYQGDTNCQTSTSDVLTQVVNKASTTTALVSNNNPSLFGQNVTFTAAVSSVAPGGGTPSGSVTFFDGTNTLATVSLSSGSANYTTSALSSGNHYITAVYGGGTNHSSSSSNELSETVQPACLIGGTTYADGTENPSNPCQACAASSNPTSWTNRSSGYACTADAYSCTSDVCDGAGSCTHPLSTGCLISGSCVATGASSPSNECMECNPALLTSGYSAKSRGVACTDDGSAITDDYCDGASICVHPLKSQCVIDSVTYQSGTANPANSCQVCDSSASTTSWTNRVNGYPCASDDLSCTWDACNDSGVCQHTVYSGCLISGKCVAGGATDTGNDCQECNPALSSSAYSNKAQGVSCADDGLSNTYDVCDGSAKCIHPLRGQCSISGQSYDAGTTNPDNICQSCDPATSSVAWTARPSGYPCTSDGLSCTNDVCDGASTCQHTLYTGCLISGTCIGASANNGTNECEECNPALSTTAYSPKARGIACTDDGSANTLDICNGSSACSHPLSGQCVIGGVTYNAGAANPGNGCQSCDPATSTTDWTARQSGFPCTSDGLACTFDVCDGAATCQHLLFTGCMIKGACVSASAANPENECEECNPALSTTTYLSKTLGVGCTDDGLTNTYDVCDGSSKCVHPLRGQCTIGGISYDAGTTNPKNVCESCDPATSATDWTARPSGFPCTSDQLTCTSDVCDGASTCQHLLFTGCLINGACVGASAVNPDSECEECNPALTTTTYSPKARGVACADDGLANTIDVCNGLSSCIHPLLGHCSIGGKTYNAGAVNPDNICQSCDPAASVAEWTARPSGFPCTTDGLACTSDVCDGASSCQHLLFTGCLIEGTCVSASANSPTNECRECNPALTTTAYSSKALGLACTDDGLDNTLDICNGAGVCSHPLSGQCVINSAVFNAGVTNPDNVCQWCDPATSATDWSSRPSGYPCTSDELSCTSDVCDGAQTCQHLLFTGCMINGACVSASAINPANECEECNPAISTALYSPKAQGVACTDDGLSNTLDICNGASICTHPLSGQCLIDEQVYNAGTANPENVCQSCEPLLSAISWTNRAAGYPCTTDGLSCTNDVCNGAGECSHTLFTGCLISGSCVADRAVDPSSDCRTCDPTVSTVQYSPKPSSQECAGTCVTNNDCAADHFCLGGVCRPDRADGQACNDNSQCSSGYCENESCHGISASGGLSCSTGGGQMAWLSTLILGLMLWRRRRVVR